MTWSFHRATRVAHSFLGLLIAGFLLVALPLALALLWSAWDAERIAQQGTRAVLTAAEEARASRSLINRLGSIERIANQIAIETDAELLADLARAHASFAAVAGELRAMPLDSGHRAALDRTVDAEHRLHEGLTAHAAMPLEGDAVAGLTRELSRHVSALQAISFQVADRETGSLLASAAELRRRLFWLISLALALALALALVLTRLIARPVAQLDDAIRRLGRGDFANRVRVNGPADLEQLGERLDWLRQRLTDLEAEKGRFLQHLSHDLRTPLTVLREGAELLRDQVAGPLAPGQQQVVAMLRENSIKLQTMIEDLLDYQRALHSTATLNAEAIELESLLGDTVRAHGFEARARGQKLTLRTAPATVWADATKLRSVVDNLVGNAIKFTPDGGTITVLARARADDVQIDVIDTGPGVPPEEREAIFDAFFRGRAGGSGRGHGTGLGLAIARDFVKAHGGRIELVETTPGGHFRVALPKRPLLQAARAST